MMLRLPTRLAVIVGTGLSLVTAALPAPAIGSQRLPACTITGTPGPDRIVGTGGPDVICGLAGDDIILGSAGDDILLAGPGDDTVSGGPGLDRLHGSAGNDRLVDTRGPGHLNGGRGSGDRCTAVQGTSFVGCERRYLAGRTRAGRPTPRRHGSAPEFVPEATSASWQDDALRVTFRVTGLRPLLPHPVSVRAVGDLRADCHGGGVDVTTMASATSSAVFTPTADAAGTVQDTGVLSLRVEPPVLRGLACRLRITRSWTATLRAIDTDAVLVLAEPATPPGRTS